MDEDFNPDEFRPAEYRPDTELTLGPMMLLGLFFGLMLLCGLCFGVGYSMGSRSARESSATGQQPGAGAVSQRSKPAATSQNTHKTQRATATAPTPAPPSASAQPAPAPGAAPAGTLMVQIAAVFHQEDADVLVSALRKRGYAATVSRDAADNQFHVRVGPFASRNDANAMRRKLLHNGYNAIVQP